MTTPAHIDSNTAESPEKPEIVVESSAIVPAGASQALARVAQRVEFYGEASCSEATRRAYTTDWERFRGWAEPLGLVVLPASPAVVAGHLTFLADEDYGVPSIKRALAAIGFHQRAAGHDWFPGHPVIAKVLRGIRRKLGRPPKQKAPVLDEALIAMIQKLPPEGDGLRDRAMLTVGWFGALRRSNIVRIEREHVRFVPEGMVIALPWSKTDQEHEGDHRAIYSQPNDTVCPVVTLQAWLEVSGITKGRVFPVSERYVARLVQRLAEEIGLDPKSYGAHSLRAGLATDAAKKKWGLRAIMQQTGHKSERVALGYLRMATLFEDNVTKDLIK
jgi:integrase